ncbi:MAG: hypothetical protein CVV47_08360 [Spirochaetae bacterium HGW-Spirochaetae-3]|jgi:GNAT superfamily N-acetyltransferase|nr:MAG: hypothetical protein CVV47_08360 [Spirochaetae bacterium HGW-Spirochaetae-3]
MKTSIDVKGRSLVFSTPENDAEFDRIVELNEAVHGSGVRDLCRTLYGPYPLMSRDDWYAVIEPDTGRALSTLCRIPTTWTYRAPGAAVAASVDVPAAELSIVATAEDARGLGLSSLLIRRYEADSARLGFTLSTIEGIPYFYRRFGYEYVAPLCVQLRLGPGLSPREGNERDSWRPSAPARGMEPGGKARLALAAEASALGLSLREAGPADAPALSRLFDASNLGLGICARRDGPLWDYLLGPGLASPETALRRLLAYRGDRLVGYLGVCADGFGPGWTVLEASVDPALADGERRAVAYAFLAEAEKERAAVGAAHLVVSLSRSHELSALALALGADDRQEYGWQAKVLDPVAFCRLAAPVLEARLAASAWNGSAYALTLDMYGTALRFDWDGSRLAAENGSASGTVPGHAPECGFPPELFAPLALGYRSVADLRRLRHDVSIYGEAEAFLDALFPPTDAYVHQFI